MIGIIKRTASAVLCMAILLLTLVFCTGCQLPGITVHNPRPSEGEEVAVFIGGKRTEIEIPEKTGGHYDHLNEDEKFIYSAAKAAVDAGQTKVRVWGIDHEKYMKIFGKALTAMLYDHPEFFWLSGEAEANVQPAPDGPIEFSIDLGIYDVWAGKDLSKPRSELDSSVKKLVSEASAMENDFEKVRFVHDSIIDSVVYDDIALETGSDVLTQQAGTAYGALIGGKALCGGYAHAFSLVMRELGFDCTYVTGTAKGGPHAWNIIELGGERYHVDLTWDDPDGEPCDRMYTYFCLSDEEMFKTHSIESGFAYLKAVGTEYNYYRYNSLMLEDYSIDAVKKMADSFNGDGVFSFRCADFEALEDAVDDLIRAGSICAVLDIPETANLTYSMDEDICVLYIIW